MKLTDVMLVASPTLSIAGTLLGVWLSNFLNERRSESQNELDERKFNKKLLLEKGEELHQLLSEWSKLVYAQQIYFSSIIMEAATRDDMNNHIKEANAGRVHDRLETLLNVYYPELGPQLEEIKSEMATSNEIFRENHMKKGRVPDSLLKSGIAIDEKFGALQKELSSRVSALIK